MCIDSFSASLFPVYLEIESFTSIFKFLEKLVNCFATRRHITTYNYVTCFKSTAIHSPCQKAIPNQFGCSGKNLEIKFHRVGSEIYY